MIKVTVDTNIIVSAGLSPFGKSAQIVNMIFDRRLQTYYSTKILTEYKEVLSRPRFNFSAEKQSAFIEGIKRAGVLIEPSVSVIPIQDESDRVFFDAAKESGAILITGNKKHYPNEAFVVTPADFLFMLNP